MTNLFDPAGLDATWTQDSQTPHPLRNYSSDVIKLRWAIFSIGLILQMLKNQSE
jgi:hypothetical protein